MRLLTFITRKRRTYAAVCVLVLAVGISLALAYRHFHTVESMEAEAPSATITLPDNPSIKSASDLQSAHDTLGKLNTINGDFQKEEDQLKQLANELQ